MVRDAIRDAGGERSGVVPKVARRLGVGESSLRSWVRQAERHDEAHLTAGWLDVGPTDGSGTAQGRNGVVTRLVAPADHEDDVADNLAAPASPVGVGERLATAARDLRRPMAWYLAARLVVCAVVLIAARQRHPGLAVMRRHVPWPGVASTSPFARAFSSWDAGWYLHIAAHGYVALPIPRGIYTRDIAFLPVFPWLVRGVASGLGTTPLAAGIFVTFLCGAAAVAGVWYAAREVAGKDVADRVAAIWCLFPGAYVLSLVYAEGLTIACAAVCVVALMRRWWLLAGVAAAIGAATQPDAIVLSLCCAWTAIAAVRSRREWAALVAPLVAPVGLAAYMAWLWARSGDPTVWVDSERVLWAHNRMGPYWTVVSPVIRVFNPGSADNAIRVAGLLLAVGGGVLLWRWRPPLIFSLWAGGTLLSALMSAPVGTRPRFLFAAFPIFIAAARNLPRWAVYCVTAVEAVGLGALTFATITGIRIVP